MRWSVWILVRGWQPKQVLWASGTAALLLACSSAGYERVPDSMPHVRARGQKQQGLADATRLAAELQKKEVKREKKGKLEQEKKSR